MANIDESTQGQEPKKRNIATVKTVLDRSKESKQFSQYKKQEKPTQIKETKVPEVKESTTKYPFINPDPLSIIGGVSKPYESNIIKNDMIASTPVFKQEIKKDALKTPEQQIASLQKSYSNAPSPEIANAVKKTSDAAYSGKFQPLTHKEDFEKDLISKVQNGEYIIDNGVIKKKPSSQIETALSAYADMYKKSSEGKDYFMMDDNQKSSYLESWYRNLPTEIPESTPQETAKMVGSMGFGVTSGIASSLITGAVAAGTGLSGGAAAPILMPLAGAALSATLTTAGSELDLEKETYKLARDKGLNQGVSYNAAKGGRSTFLTTSFAENLALNYTGIKATGALSNLQKESGNVLLKYLKNIGMVRIPEAIGSSGLSAGSEYLRAEKIKKETGGDIDPSERAKDVFTQGLALQGMFNGVGAIWGAGKIGYNKAVKSAILNHAANQERSFVNNMLMQYKQNGHLTEEQFKLFNEDLDNFIKEKKKNPDIPEAKAPAVVGLGIKKKKLQDQAKQSDGSNRADLEVKIQEVDERIKDAISGKGELDGELDDITKNPFTQEGQPAKPSKKYIVDGVEVSEEDFNKATGNKQIIDNATTKTTEQQQTGKTEGGISEHNGVEVEQAQTTNEADNRNRPVSGSQEEVTPDLFKEGESNSVFKKMTTEANNQLNRKADDLRGATQKAISILKNSAFYKNLDGNDREKYIISATDHFNKELPKSLGAKQTLDKIIGNSVEKVTVTEKFALRRLIKAQQATANGIKQARQQISDGIAALDLKRGSVKATKFANLLKKYDKLDITNDVKVGKFVDYMSNLIKNADYEDNVSEANSLRTRIKSMSKSKDTQGNLAAAAKEFSKLDPEDFDDISEYISKAKEVADGIKPGRTTATGANLQQAFNESDLYDFIDNHNTKVAENMKANKMADYQDLVDSGIIDKDMSFDDMEFIIQSIEDGADPKSIDNNKSASIKKFAERRFSNLAGIAKSILETGDDGFGNKVDVKLQGDDLQILKDVLKIGVKNMSVKNSYKIADAVQNFITNGEHYGLEKVLREHYGERNASYIQQSKVKAKPFNKAEIRAYELVGSLPQTFSNMFGSRTMDIQTASGFTGFKNATAKASFKFTEVEDAFHLKFSKTKPNGLAFNDADNVTEMNMYAHMLRNMGGTQQEIADEFLRRKGIIQASINNLKNSRNTDLIQQGELYKRVYDKLLDGVDNISDLKSRVDKTNIDAVHYWIDKWNDMYTDMNSMSKNYYNKKLRKDNFFTPDIYKKTGSGSFVKVSEDVFEDGMISNNRVFPKKASGRFQEQVGPESIGNDTYLSLDFLHDTKQSYKSTLVDLYGSKYIGQMSSFLKSEGFASMFDNVTDQKLIEKKMKSYVNASRGNFLTDMPIDKNSVYKFVNKVSGIATAGTIAGARNFVQQFAPIANAYANTGKINVKEAVHDVHVQRLLNNSGRDIANASFTGDVSFSEVDNFMRSYQDKPDLVMDFLTKQSSKMLKTFVGNSDSIARRSSFWSFYLKNLEDRGINTKDTDWSTVDKLDDIAADYAQDMIDRTQNVVQTDLKGELLSSRNPSTSLAKSMLFPLSDFMLNQKLSFWNNVNKIYSKSSSIQDKINGAKGTLSIMAEALAYNAIKHTVNAGYQTVADFATDYKPSEKEQQLRSNRAMASGISNLIGDLSPLPPQMNPLVIGGINNLYDGLFNEGVPDELKMEFKDLSESSTNPLKGLGLLGIPAENIMNAGVSLWNVGAKGVVKNPFDKYKDDKYVADQDRTIISVASGVQLLSQSGLLPSDLNQISNRISSNISKKAMTKESKLVYDELIKQGNELRKRNADLKDIDGKNVYESFAASNKIKDPMRRGEYINEIFHKYGEKDFSYLMESLSNSSYDAKIKTRDLSLLLAAKTGNRDIVDMATAMSYSDEDAQVYSMFKKRENMNVAEFYDHMAYLVKSGVISNKFVFKYAAYMQDKMKDPSIDMQMLSKSMQRDNINLRSSLKK